jgi:hypothetical protein
VILTRSLWFLELASVVLVYQNKSILRFTPLESWHSLINVERVPLVDPRLDLVLRWKLEHVFDVLGGAYVGSGDAYGTYTSATASGR